MNSNSILSNTCNRFQFNVFCKLYEILFNQLANCLKLTHMILCNNPHDISTPWIGITPKYHNTTVRYFLPISSLIHLSCVHKRMSFKKKSSKIILALKYFKSFPSIILVKPVSVSTEENQVFLISVNNDGECQVFILLMIIHWLTFSSSNASLEISHKVFQYIWFWSFECHI